MNTPTITDATSALDAHEMTHITNIASCEGNLAVLRADGKGPSDVNFQFYVKLMNREQTSLNAIISVRRYMQELADNR